MCERKAQLFCVLLLEKADVFLCPPVLTSALILQVVGVAARQGRVWNSANTVVKVKQLLGRRFLIMF